MQKMGWFEVVRGHSRSWTIPPFDRAHRLPIRLYNNRNYVSIFYCFRDIAGYLSKVADFNLPHLHLAPPQRFILVEFRGDLWRQKTRVTGLSSGVVYMIPHLAVLVEHRLVADTDRQTNTVPWLVPRMHNIAR